MVVTVGLAALAVSSAAPAAPAGQALQPCVATGPQWTLDNGMSGAQHKVIRGTKYTLTLGKIGDAAPPTCAFAKAWLSTLLRKNRPRQTVRPSSQKLVGGPKGFTCIAFVAPPPNTGFFRGQCEKVTARADGGTRGSAFVWKTRVGAG